MTVAVQVDEEVAADMHMLLYVLVGQDDPMWKAYVGRANEFMQPIRGVLPRDATRDAEVRFNARMEALS